MQQVMNHIEKSMEQLERHPFFARLRPERDLRRLMAFAPASTFWVMIFQDLIRLNAELARDPAVRRTLEQHQTEDAGHEQWFLEDLERLFGSAPRDVHWLFGPENREMRSASLAVVAEVFAIADDRLRLVLLEMLEASAGLYFGRVSRALAESGHAEGLKYFAGIHLKAEAGHEIHAEAARKSTEAIVMPPELRAQAHAMLDRITAAFFRMLEVFLRAMDDASTSASGQPALRTFRELGQERLGALCSALGMQSCQPTASALFDDFLAGWGDRRIGTTPGWRSDVTDDHTPFEFSVALEEGRPELRFLVEVQTEPVTDLQRSWDAGLRASEDLRRKHGVSLERLHCIADLFAPQDPAASFSLWHAVCLAVGEAPEFKVYLNPRSRGLDQAATVVREALHRLGFDAAWEFLNQRVLRGPEDQILYFSLDLASHDDVRVKLYVAHANATAEGLETLLTSVGGGFLPGEAAEFCQAVAAREGPYRERAPLTCYAFTPRSRALPGGVTLYLPVRTFVDHDQMAVERITDWLDDAERPLWSSAVAAVAARPLDAGRGLVQWASLKRRHGRRRVTFYLAPEAYTRFSPRPRPGV